MLNTPCGRKEEPTMRNYRICFTCLMIALALGLVTPQFQFAQDASKNAEGSGQQSSQHILMIGLVRTINTAEVKYHGDRGTYGSWEALLGNNEQYLNGWLARFGPQTDKIHFSALPEVLPGMNLRLNVAPDGRTYVVLVEDTTDKSGFAFVSDERGIIRYCQFIR